MAWSSGKDSLWALRLIRQSGICEVVGLLTTVTEAYGRVSMHGVRESLLHAQASALGLSLYRIPIPTPCSDEEYDSLMSKAMGDAQASGVSAIVFGDIHLAGVREYREKQLAQAGMRGVFPLWAKEPVSLAQEMIAAGVRAYVTCLDPRKLPRELAGHAFDAEFLSGLPHGVDPCGENGEFHTFAWDGPGYCAPIAVRVGETVEREGFVFTDLLSGSS
jgi:uncharacterized protein (TIGR00290 family)